VFLRDPGDVMVSTPNHFDQLARHEKALQLLAIELKDSVSAETYCTQGGDVLPPKTARAISDRIKVLEPWATLDEVGPRRRGTIEGEPRQHLVSILLKVYMAEGLVTCHLLRI
jgi:hypothetical protein